MEGQAARMALQAVAQTYGGDDLSEYLDLLLDAAEEAVRKTQVGAGKVFACPGLRQWARQRQQQ